MREIRLGLMALLLCVSFKSFSQSKLPNSLLWRISGNGLAHPSYLYGTMHLQDRRLFNFSDSVYAAIENTEGLALEVNFRDLVDSMFSKTIENVQASKEDQEAVKIDTKVDKGADSAMKALGLQKDKLTRRDLKRITEYRMQQLAKASDMPTIVDGFLYGLALRQNKWTGGIEDVDDQLNIVDVLGAEIRPEEILQSTQRLREATNEMIRLYLNQDINGIDNFINKGYDGNWKNKVVLTRNIKMARRMDSLLAQRSMFYAIGAAHLAGDSGVINLLRKKGFSVEPVFSKSTTPGDVYAKKLNAVPWLEVGTDEDLYSLSMPGRPSQHSVFGEGSKVKIFFDLTSMTFYMVNQALGNLKSQKDADVVFSGFTNSLGVDMRKLKKKQIERNGLKGYSGEMSAPAGMFRLELFQKDNSIFFLMMGANKQDHLDQNNASRFFGSFKMKDNHALANWHPFSLPSKGLEVYMPGTPKRNILIDRQAEGSMWHFTDYDLVDNQTGLYYLLQIRDIEPGYFIMNDSSYREKFSEDFKTRFDKVDSLTTTTLQGLPAYYFEGSLVKEGVKCKILHVLKGGRVYALNVFGSIDANFANGDKFIHSLEIGPVTLSPHKLESTSSFSAQVPQPWHNFKNDTANDRITKYYQSYDSADAVTFIVLTQNLTKYDHSTDSLFFAAVTSQYVPATDSLLSRKTVKVKGLNALDLIVFGKGDVNAKRVRAFASGDTSYLMLAYIPLADKELPGYQLPFESFAPSKASPPSYLKSKSNELLTDIYSMDSATRAHARIGLNDYVFEPEDVKMLEQAWLKSSKDSDGLFDYDYQLKRAITALDDTTVLNFVKRSYSKLSKDAEGRKYELLGMLAQKHTAASYGQLKYYILNELPKAGDAGEIHSHLLDSIALAKTLFPELLEMSRDSIFRLELMNLVPDLLDSNVITVAQLGEWKGYYLSEARKFAATADSSSDEWVGWVYVKLLGKFQEPASFNILDAFMKSRSMDLKLQAIETLVANHQPLDPTALRNLASDIKWRFDIYDTLSKAGKTDLLPKEFTTAKSLGASLLHNIITEDYEYEDLDISFVTERKETVNGHAENFLLYNISYKEGDGKQSYLGIVHKPEAGQTMSWDDNLTGVYWSENFDKNKIAAFLKSFVSPPETLPEAEALPPDSK